MPNKVDMFFAALGISMWHCCKGCCSPTSTILPSTPVDRAACGTTRTADNLSHDHLLHRPTNYDDSPDVSSPPQLVKGSLSLSIPPHAFRRIGLSPRAPSHSTMVGLTFVESGHESFVAHNLLRPETRIGEVSLYCLSAYCLQENYSSV